MQTITNIPVTLTERLAYGEDWRVQATWEEFLDLLEECEYQIQYDEGEIFSTMGYASKLHEKLMIRMGFLLYQMFMYSDALEVCGSNLALHIPGFIRRYYNADCSVVREPSEEVELRGDMVSIANPILLVEVLSPATRDFDMGRKFENYKKIPSLEQVIFAECTEQKVTVCRRQNDWKEEVFENDADLVPVLEESHIRVADVYRKIDFGEA